MIANSPRVFVHERIKSLKTGLFSQNWLVLVVLVVLMGFMGGCVSVSPAPELPALGTHVFLLDGKLSIRRMAYDAQNPGTPRPGKRTSVSLNFRWREYTEGFDIQFWGPFGQGRSHLVGTPQQVELTTPDGHTHYATDLESLMQRWLGWSLPVGVLRYWVRGLPAPALELADIERRESGDILGFQQLGWILKFQDYTETQGRRVPGRVIAKHGGTRLILVNRAWQFDPGEE